MGQKRLSSIIKGEALAEKLVNEGIPLWRYAEDTTPFDKEDWEITLHTSWEKKQCFPVLYKEKRVYDKREVVFCFLITAGISLDEADMLLDTLSVNNQNWDTRRLYPLHFKEGFFRLVLAWNARHNHKFSFIEAVEKYEEYERQLVQMLRQEFEIIHSKIREMRKLNIISKDFELAGYYHDLCEELWSKFCEWHHPYQLLWQDELQRFIVLLAHAKRFLDEVEKQSSAEILYRNSYTRRLSERGTRLCMAITETCARMERWEEALQLFLEQAVPTMGEAYWRTFSWLIKKYNSSGAMPQREDVLHRKRIISRRNKCAKKIWELPVIESEVLSFGVDAEEIRTLIRDNSANTTLIAELLIPSLNIPNFVFHKRDSNINQTTLCLLLKNYFLWCEGHTKYVSQGIARLATPFYEYKRETIIKYVLACGCLTVNEMQMFLELSGCRTLQKDKPQEQLVYTALKQCEMHRTNNPIERILDMQNRTLYQLIQKRTKGESVINDALVKKCVQHYRSGLLYEVEFSQLSIRDVKLTKQQFIDVYYSIQVILMLLLVEVSCIYDHICAEQRGEIVQYMMDAFTLKNIATDEYGGFLLYIDQPENMDVQYVEELKEEFESSFELHQINMDAATVSRIQQMLILLNQYLEVLYTVEGGNAPELKILYDKGYYILALLSCIGVDTRSKEINDMYRNIMCKIKDLSIFWTLAGGCKNFSITFYEQKYRINHFSQKHQKANSNTGNRFIRYLHEVNEDLEVWDNIAEDARIIRKCATYIRHKIPHKIGVFLNGLESCAREMKNISKLLDEIMQELGNDTYERTIRSKLLSVKEDLYIFK